MAKSLLKTYIYVPGVAGSGQLIIPGKIDLSQLLVITNTTRNVILYNFSDPNFASTTAVFSRGNLTGNVTATSTSNSASSGSTALTATTATGLIEKGMVVSGSANIPTGTYVTAVSGTAITLSTATTGSVSNASLTFTGSSYANLVNATDGYTTITLQYVNGSAHAKTDNIQIFYESEKQFVRMHTVGTDAFERTRVANPQAMLDADFEYGLQPTKWQMINMLRGYPSIYEVPGTDITVTAVVTDASNGNTSSVGASLITVTCGVPHNYTAGSPITIKGLANTVSGFARAEGTFIINQITSDTTFNYYAKAKVGSSVVTATSTTNSAAGGTTALTATAATGTITAGMVVSGTGIETGTTVTAVSGTSVTLSQATSAITNASLTFTGEVVSSSYTQLRKGGFFTGASVGVPTFSITTNGTSSSYATITVTFATPHGFVPGDTIMTTITSTDTNHSLAQGPFFVESVPTSTTLTYTTRAYGALGTSLTLTGIVYARPDCFYSHRPFDGGVVLGTGGPAHGAHAIRMSKKYIRYQSGKSIMYNTGLLLAPNYDVRSMIATNNSATTYTQTTSGTNSAGSTSLVLGSGTNTANNQLVSGTGIADGTYIVSGGGTTTLTLNLPIASTISNGTTITFTPGIVVTTDDIDHSLQAGASVTLSGATTSGFNGTYTVGSVIDERNFIVPVGGALGTTTAVIGSPCLVSTLGWVGSTVRAGTFDDQNGQFWQYDGQTVAVGYRSSTWQTAGVVTVTPDSNSITQTSSSVPTRFQEQFAEGDRVVIRGMSHVVAGITSNSQMYVTPDYRGTTTQTGVKMVRTKDFLFKQSEWNIDRCDGSNGPFNPSGFNLNVNKMQMVGIAWTWYGAGFIEWMLRGPDGNYIAVHRVKASNVNTEAYMRSGNQPVRYEVINEGPRTQLSATVAAADTTINVKDTSWFPTSGYLWMEGEIVKYTGKTQTTKYDLATDTGSGAFTGCTRAATDFKQYIAGSYRTFTGGSAQSTTALNTGVILLNQLATPVISHWGSAFLQDGGFDQDRGYIFNYAATNISVSTKKSTAFALRLAPSVSNAIIGDLGTRDLLNRAQLLLQGLEITAGGATGTNAGIVVEGVLNPTNYPSNLANITWNSLQTSAAGGLPSFCQIATGSSITFENQTNTVLSTTAATAPVAGATSMNINGITSLSITSIGSNGQVTVSSTAFTANQPVAISGTQSGTGVIAGYTSGTVYYVQSTGTTTTPTLLTSPGGVAVVTTAGTTSGLTLVTNPPIIGDEVWSSATGITFSGATKISAKSSYPSSTTATITFDKPIPTSPAFTAGTTNVTISRGTAAAPGETIFSFISSPAGKDQLDLTPLKELVNTPLGGRGTFPNGPDVLMINVYLTQGAALTGNLVLRWGEAQA